MQRATALAKEVPSPATMPVRSSFSSIRGGLLQRKCACGGIPDPTGECEACRKKRVGLQAKLTVNPPGDVYEQDANRIADRMMATVHPNASEMSPRIQRLSGESNGQIDGAPPSVEDALASPGRPLEPVLRKDMERRFRHDFGDPSALQKEVVHE